MRYKTKADAQRAVRKKNDTEPNWTCPLLNGQKCQKYCVCFRPAYVHELDYKIKEYLVHGYDCINGMFWREVK